MLPRWLLAWWPHDGVHVGVGVGLAGTNWMLSGVRLEGEVGPEQNAKAERRVVHMRVLAGGGSRPSRTRTQQIGLGGCAPATTVLDPERAGGRGAEARTTSSCCPRCPWSRRRRSRGRKRQQSPRRCRRRWPRCRCQRTRRRARRPPELWRGAGIQPSRSPPQEHQTSQRPGCWCPAQPPRRGSV